jgi:membrane protease subunit HflK
MDLATLLDSDPQQIARRVQAQAQAALDAANSGIDITGLSAGADALRVPQAVQASYAQVKQVRAEKTAAAAQAASAASQMMAAATQEVTRLQDEARAYSKQVVAEAQAESAQFATVLPEYQRLPQAVRDRLYYDTMQQVYGQMNKVVVDSQSGQAIHIALERPAVAQAAAPAPGASASGATAAGSKAGAASAATSARTAASAGDAATNPLRSRDPDLLRQKSDELSDRRD